MSFVQRDGFYQPVTESYTPAPSAPSTAPTQPSSVYVLPQFANLMTSPNAISLTEPSNIFSLQNSISNNLNNFQTKYSRYMRCQDPLAKSQVTDPTCNLNTYDSFDSLNESYRSLLNSIQDLSSSMVAQTHLDAKTPLQNDTAAAEIPITYADLVKLRQQLDQQLQLLYAQMGNGQDSPVRRLESTMYANTLWIILASCLVYYIFVEL